MNNNQKILAIDIGGSNIKAAVLSLDGEFVEPYKKLATPEPSTPEKVMEGIRQLADQFSEYDRVSAGFPGFVKHGVVQTAPNLGTKEWANFDLEKSIQIELDKPALVLNDADLQALGLVSGEGVEMVITLGTGLGTAILNDGVLIPHLEISHHPVTKRKDYDQYIGKQEMQRIGKKRWNNRMVRVLDILKTVVNYDRLYISGGGSDELDFKLDKNIFVVGNRDGIKGGAVLWSQKLKEQNHNLAESESS